MIYVITHKKFNVERIPSKGYQILQVGGSHKINESFLTDDSGNNISFKNKCYCELTGLYWIWKNASYDDSNIVGLIHYRRFFVTNFDYMLYKAFNRPPRIAPFSFFERKIEDNVIAVARHLSFDMTMYEQYATCHIGSDLDKVRNIIVRLFPQYIESFDTCMKSRRLCPYNMFVSTKKTMDEYCEWLFTILFKLEESIDYNLYDDYQKRVFGFISERLLNVWIYHNSKHSDLKVLEFPVWNSETL